MAFTVEFSAESERDFELIFDHLFESYTGFGEATETALDHAARRIMEIRQAAEQLSTFPIRGTARADVLPGVRFVASTAQPDTTIWPRIGTHIALRKSSPATATLPTHSGSANTTL